MSVAVGVAHDAIVTSFRPVFAAGSTPPLLLVGVGQSAPEQSLPFVRRVDLESRNTERFDGVAAPLKVVANSVEPREASFARNLLAKKDVGAESAFDSMYVRP
jgi:hypothetical protein